MGQKQVKATLKLSKKQIQENEALAGFYDEEQGLVVFEMNEGLTDEFVGKVQELVSDEKINVRELVQLSPLMLAVNELQMLKDLEYDPEIELDELDKAGEKLGIKFEIEDDDIAPAAVVEWLAYVRVED